LSISDGRPLARSRRSNGLKLWPNQSVLFRHPTNANSIAWQHLPKVLINRRYQIGRGVALRLRTQVAPEIAAAAGEENPTAPASQNKSNKDTQTKKKKDKSSSAEDFLNGYHAAYKLIYDKSDYEGGIAALHALGYDDNADVATLLGYASRKLGRYDDAKIWYERALAADPDHAVTWSYYGMWQAEQGNLLKAKDDLEKVRLICGTDCKPYKMLKDVIEGTETY
jgi:tetratricopeptide (TPR) repeat protein